MVNIIPRYASIITLFLLMMVLNVVIAPATSQNNEQLVFESERNLWLLDPTNPAEPQPLTTYDSSGAKAIGSSPLPSPDGRFITYMEFYPHDAKSSLVILDWQKQTILPVLTCDENQYLCVDPRLSTDNTRILYSRLIESDDSGFISSIWLMDLRENPPAHVLLLPDSVNYNDTLVTWVGSEEVIVARSPADTLEADTTSFFRYTIATQSLVPLGQMDVLYGLPRFTPDGARYVRPTRSGGGLGSTELSVGQIMLGEGETEKLLSPTDESIEEFIQAWHPDGIHLLILQKQPQPDAREYAIVQINTQTGEVELFLSELGYAFIDARWNADGTKFAFTRTSDTETMIGIYDIKTHRSQLLTRGRNPQWVYGG